MSDRQQRELARAWLATGDVERGAEFLRGELRNGRLSADQLHLAAYLGQATARLVYDVPSRETLQAALPQLLEGLEQEISDHWGAFSRDDEEITQALDAADRLGPAETLLRAASKYPQLRRLRPVTSLVSLGFSQSTDFPFTETLWIHPDNVSLASEYRVQAPDHERDVLLVTGEHEGQAPDRERDVLLVTGDPEEAVRFVAETVAPDLPVWRGDRSALGLARVRAGALDAPAAPNGWLASLAVWGEQTTTRACLALATLLQGEEAPEPEVLDQLTAKLLELPPLPAISEGKAEGPAPVIEDPDDWLDSLQAELPLLRVEGLLGRPPERPLAELQRVVREALVPWALGLEGP